jgi:hypothetical protein
MSLVISSNPKAVRQTLEKAGSQIGSVHFRKRSNGELRKMCYRLHVKKPSMASVPRKGTINKRQRDLENGQMTVFDVNKVIWKDGIKVGRGAWRTVPLENVERICVSGKVYTVQGRKRV